MIQEVDLVTKSLSDYKKLITSETYEEIKSEAKSLKGLKVAHLNTTQKAGGVAELIRSFVPLQKDLGLDSSWYVGHESDDFFTITKQIHNFLQGKKGDLTDDQKKL